ncbi:hypothetical protein Glove_97g115 [Diversispora epigaea]|uniref:Uncharacterized protein n=1 Tax=Diversispora epigaea TaxID=1348612 RepID=A0A397JBE4_9GLOM|nr:hypothetical protein Glove_97g115 [Diversispora epigaea]
MSTAHEEFKHDPDVVFSIGKQEQNKFTRILNLEKDLEKYEDDYWENDQIMITKLQFKLTTDTTTISTNYKTNPPAIYTSRNKC